MLLKLKILLVFLAVKGDEEGSGAREAVAKLLLRTGAIEDLERESRRRIVFVGKSLRVQKPLRGVLDFEVGRVDSSRNNENNGGGFVWSYLCRICKAEILPFQQPQYPLLLFFLNKKTFF